MLAGLRLALKSLPPASGCGVDEEAVVEAHLGGERVVGGEPGQRALDLDRVGARRAALGVGDDRRQHAGDVAGVVLLAAGALDDVAVLEADAVAGEEAKEALRRHLGEVVALDPELGAEAQVARAELRMLRMDRRMAGLAMRRVAEGLGPVGERQADRVEHRHRPRRLRVEVVAQRDLEARVVGPAARLAGAGALAQQADRLRRVAAPAQPGDRRHARVVPAVDDLLVDELPELSLARDHVADVEARELVLVRPRLGEQAERRRACRAASRRTAAGPRTRACRSSG